MRVSLSATLAVAVVVSSGCGEEVPRGEVREWRPSDHAQPSQPDPARQAPETSDEPSPEMLAQAAASLFGARCASCHGPGGAGDGAAAPVADMPDLTAAGWHDANTDAEIARVIRMGSGLMPAFGGQLHERGIRALVAHIRSLRPAP